MPSIDTRCFARRWVIGADGTGKTAIIARELGQLKVRISRRSVIFLRCLALPRLISRRRGKPPPHRVHYLAA